MTSSYVIPLNTPYTTLDIVGGKGMSLAKMASAGFAVPDGFCLSTAVYKQFVDANDLQAQIVTLAAPAIVKGVVSFEAASIAIQALFDAPIPEDIVTEATAAFAGLNDEHGIAVRSSATAEDLPGLSFAGQQDTYLNVRGEDAFIAAVKDCWASLWTQRAMSYRYQQGIDNSDIAMAVVVQIMVPTDISGILFTANPVTGERSEMIVNASFGLGEAIVSGQVTPDTYVVDRDSLTVKETTLSTKSHKIVDDGAQGTRLEAIAADQRDLSSLSEDALTELASTALEIEQHFDGVPQDIEWASEGSYGFYLLQSRPITNLPPQPIEVSWDLPSDLDPAVDVLMRRQILENVPDPVSPLFEDLYQIKGIKKVRMLNGFAYMPFSRTATTPARRLKRFEDANSQTASMAAKEKHDMAMFVAQLSTDDQARFNKVAGELNSETLPHLITNPDDSSWSIRSRTEDLDPMVEGFRSVRKPKYLAKIAEWRDMDKSTASGEQLLTGMRELAASEAVTGSTGRRPKGEGSVDATGIPTA